MAPLVRCLTTILGTTVLGVNQRRAWAALYTLIMTTEIGFLSNRNESRIPIEGQYLLVDADDTLWQNNIYFDRAVDAFIDFLDHSSMPPDRVRLILQEIEIVTISAHGYGAANFGRSLQACYEHLTERHVSEDDIATILGLAEEIMLQEIDLLPGVADTLPQHRGNPHQHHSRHGQPEAKRGRGDGQELSDLAVPDHAGHDLV